MKKIKYNIVYIFFLVIVTISIGCSNKNQLQKEIIISVAASLEEPVKELTDKYMEENKDIKISVNLGSSGTLRKQIQEGANVDLFLSANKLETEKLVDEGIVNSENNEEIITNGLLLVKSSDTNEKVKSVNDLVGKNIKLAIGEESVPIGKYSKEALKSANIFFDLKDKIVYCKDAKSVLNYVKLGEVDYAIVYTNEMDNLEKQQIVEKIDSNMHEPIVYSLAQINTSEYVIKFKEYINRNIEIFEKYNFDRK